MIFYAKNYKTRELLNYDICNKSGFTIDKKPQHSIEGTKAELLNLRLMPTSMLWGIACKAVEPTENVACATPVDMPPEEDLF